MITTPDQFQFIDPLHGHRLLLLPADVLRGPNEQVIAENFITLTVMLVVVVVVAIAVAVAAHKVFVLQQIGPDFTLFGVTFPFVGLLLLGRGYQLKLL